MLLYSLDKNPCLYFSGALALAKGAGAPGFLSKTAIFFNRVQGDGIFQAGGLNKL